MYKMGCVGIICIDFGMYHLQKELEMNIIINDLNDPYRQMTVSIIGNRKADFDLAILTNIDSETFYYHTQEYNKYVESLDRKEESLVPWVEWIIEQECQTKKFKIESNELNFVWRDVLWHTYEELKHALLWDLIEDFDLKEVLREWFNEELNQGWEPTSVEEKWNEALDWYSGDLYTAEVHYKNWIYVTSAAKLFYLLKGSNHYANESEYFDPEDDSNSDEEGDSDNEDNELLRL